MVLHPKAVFCCGGVTLGQMAEHPAEREEFPQGCTAIGQLLGVPLVGQHSERSPLEHQAGSGTGGDTCPGLACSHAAAAAAAAGWSL